MRGPNVIWLIVLALATVWLGMRFSGGEMARVYVRHVQVEAPIEVVVNPGGGKSGTPEIDTGFFRDIGKGSVAVIMK